MIKEAVEDYKRYKQDKDINNRKIDVLDSTLRAFVSKAWSDVRVGDIVRVTKDEQFPADILFLTSETDEGTCYIETMNLDGETNLKIKKAMDVTMRFRAAEDPAHPGAPLLTSFAGEV
jgi:P-type E1-E2 ATPase